MDLQSLSDADLLKMADGLPPSESPSSGASLKVTVRPGDAKGRPISEWSDAELLAAQAGANDTRPAMSKLLGINGERYQLWPERLVRHVASSVASGVTAPGDALQNKFAPAPETPGLLTEGDVLRQDVASGKEIARAFDTAFIGTPMAPRVVAGAEKAVVPTAKQLKTSGSAGFTQAREAATGDFSPEITNALADSTIAVLNKKGRFQHLAPEVHSTVDLLRGDKSKTLDELRSILEGLGSLSRDPDEKIRAAAGMAANEIKQFIGRTEPKSAGILERANADYGASKRAQQLDVAADVAGLRTGRAGYGGNSVNAMRQVLSPIVENAIKGNTRGFSAEEIRAMRNIVEGTTATNTLRGIGMLSPSKGGIASGIALATGGTTAAIGAVANKLASFLTSRQINRLNDLVRRRSAAYQDAVSKSSERYFSAADGFMMEPTPANFAKTMITARALSSGLTRDGIPVSSADLLRYLQAPTKSAAEDDENRVPRPPGQ